MRSVIFMRIALGYCETCKKEFLGSVGKCPICGKSMKSKILYTNDEKSKNNFQSRSFNGEGRRYGTGGAACDICPHCNGDRNWCPYMD